MKLKSKCAICSLDGYHPSWRVRDMCRESDETFVYLQCTGCGCLHIKDVPDKLSAYYDSAYYSFAPLSERSMQDPSWKRLLRKRAAFVGTTNGWYCGLLRRLCSFPVHQEWFLKGNVSFSSRILDIGCGSGALLVRIWKEGFTGATGIDPYIPADIRYKNGLEIRKVTLGEFGPDGAYDFIMMNHSFEHIPAQHAAFADIERLLAPGGTALLRVPVSGSYAWERYGTDWVHLEAPRHLYLHTEKSIGVLAREAGLKLKDVVYDSDELQFYGSELLKDGLIKNVRDYKEYMKEHSETAFTRAQMRAWKKESERLNGIKRGDQACFYLGRP